jgi:serine/threonine-protein kinase
MPTTDLGACEWFVWDLRRSNLIDRGKLDQVVGEFLTKHPRAEPPALAEYLVSRGILSQFQVDCLLKGKTQGLVLGPYTLSDTLGTGSMGTVYKAVSKTDNRPYAVKVLPRRSMWNVRIARRLVRSFEQCKHPTVVPFVDVGTAGGTHYLAWPLVEGETLDKIVEREGKLSPGLAALYAKQTAEGLDVCHKNSLVHGLLKPSNLMIGTDGQVHILDFGIGSLLAETEGESLVDTMSTSNSLTSGLDCASPESIMEPTNRTAPGDQYSLGCTLYYCLTGSYPFPVGSTVEKMMAHQTEKAKPVRELRPEVPEELSAVVDRLMQKDPGARYGSAAEIVAALEPFAAEAPTAPRIVATPPAPTSRGRVPERELRPESGRRVSPAPVEPYAAPAETPRPPVGSGGGLRKAMFDRPPSAPVLPPVPPAPAPATAPPVPEFRVPPGAVPDSSWLPKRTLEDRIGNMGIMILTLLVLVAVFFAARYFLNLF